MAGVTDGYNHTGQLMCIINIYKKAQHRQDRTLTMLSSTLPATRSLPALKLSFVKVCFGRFANFFAFHSAFETWVQSQVNLFPSGLLGSWLASQWVFIFYFWNFCILLSFSRRKLNSPGCCDSLLPFGVLLWLCAGYLLDLFLVPWLFSAVTHFTWFIPVLRLVIFIVVSPATPLGTGSWLWWLLPHWCVSCSHSKTTVPALGCFSAHWGVAWSLSYHLCDLFIKFISLMCAGHFPTNWDYSGLQITIYSCRI